MEPKFVLLNLALALGMALFGYLLGSIPNGVLIGKIFYGVDITKEGSGNSGGTNAGRVLGKKAGYAVVILDILKTVFAFWIPWVILAFSGIREAMPLWERGIPYVYLALLCSVVGHCWSIFRKFTGGKAVSSFYACSGGISWVSFIFDFITFFACFLKKRIMSKANLIAGAIVVAYVWVMFIVFQFCQWNEGILMWNFGLGESLFFNWEQAVVVTLSYGIMVFRHRENIKRLAKGEEKPIHWK